MLILFGFNNWKFAAGFRERSHRADKTPQWIWQFSAGAKRGEDGSLATELSYAVQSYYWWRLYFSTSCCKTSIKTKCRKHGSCPSIHLKMRLSCPRWTLVVLQLKIVRKNATQTAVILTCSLVDVWLLWLVKVFMPSGLLSLFWFELCGRGRKLWAGPAGERLLSEVIGSQKTWKASDLPDGHIIPSSSWTNRHLKRRQSGKKCRLSNIHYSSSFKREELVLLCLLPATRGQSGYQKSLWLGGFFVWVWWIRLNKLPNK